MAVQDRVDEARPTAYQRSVDLPQAFGCNPFDFVWLLLSVIFEILLHPCHTLSLVRQKLEEVRCQWSCMDCSQSHGLIVLYTIVNVGRRTLPMVLYGL
jgi:hypothetical protein